LTNQRLGAVPGMETAVADTRARLEALDAEREETTAQRDAVLPAREHATDRAALLQRVAAARHGMLDMLSALELLEPGVAYTPDAAAFLQALGHTPTADVVLAMLQRAPRDRIRKLMRDLGAVVLVTRPHSRAEWATWGATPPALRVALLVPPRLTVRSDAANVLALAQLQQP
jgi:hypothetical protein